MGGQVCEVTRGPRPVVTMKLIVPAERAELVLTYLPKSPGRLRYGIETHELHPFKPGSRPRPRVPEGMGAGGAGRLPPPSSSWDGEEMEDEVEEEEEHLAGIEMEKLDINELLDDKDSDEMDKEQEK